MGKLDLKIKDEYWYNNKGSLERVKILEHPDHDKSTIVVNVDFENNTPRKIKRRSVSIQDLHLDKELAVRHAMQSIFERQIETSRLIKELKKFVKEHNVKDKDSICAKNNQ